MRPTMTMATAAAKTASSQNSDLILRSSSGRAFASGLVAANRVKALRDRGHLETERRGRELLQLVQRLGGLLGARVEIALYPALSRTQVLAVTCLVAREERQARVQQPQAQGLADKICLRRRQHRAPGVVDLAHDHELAHVGPHPRGK